MIMIIFRDVWNLTKVQWLDYTLPGTDISYPLIFRGVQHKAGSKLHVPSMFLSTKGVTPIGFSYGRLNPNAAQAPGSPFSTAKEISRGENSKKLLTINKWSHKSLYTPEV